MTERGADVEHYALLQPGTAVAAPPGLRAIRVRNVPVGEARTIAHDLLRVVALQPTIVRHYAGDSVAPVHPDPALLAAQGWTYRHLEMRYAPVVIDADGRLEALDPDDPRWSLVDPDTPEARIEAIAEGLKAREVDRQLAERAAEQAEARDVEIEGD